jgi:hypothetical protein
MPRRSIKPLLTGEISAREAVDGGSSRSLAILSC